jgi:hypothetical protein
MAPEKKSTEAPEKPLDGFLATVETRIAALQQLKESYLAAVSIGAFGLAGEIDLSMSNGTRGTSYDLPTGAMLGKSVPQAIKLYLGAVRKKQTASEIMSALKDGGVESTAANFLNNVTSSLHRLKTSGDVLQFKDGWALAEFYPESLRARIAKETAPKKRIAREAAPGKKPRKARKPVQGKTAKAKATKSRSAPEGPGLSERVLASLRGRDFASSRDLSNELKVAPSVLNLMLGRLVKQQKVERSQDGQHYRLPKKAA